MGCELRPTVHNGKAEAHNATGERAKADEFDLDRYPSIRAALNKDSGDRSADTCAVMGACLREGLTFPQACWAIYRSPRLAERLSERKEDDEIDLLRCWLRVVDDQQRTFAGACYNGEYKQQVRLLSLQCAADISDDIPDWAWAFDDAGRIQLAVLTLFAGRPGTGKSTGARWFSARWSKGELPGLWLGKPQTVAYVASEDPCATSSSLDYGQPVPT